MGPMTVDRDARPSQEPSAPASPEGPEASGPHAEGGENTHPPTTPAPGSGGHRNRPTSEAFRRFIASGWAPRPQESARPPESALWAATRRQWLSAAFPGTRLVVPAGVLQVRSNDTDHRFRAHSAFAHLTGLGSRSEPDSVLVLEPRGFPPHDHRGQDHLDDGDQPSPGDLVAPGDLVSAEDLASPDSLESLEAVEHEAILFFRPPSPRDSTEFYADARYGELWVGPRPTLAEIEELTGLRCRHLDELTGALTKDVGEGCVPVRMVRAADPGVDQIVDEARQRAGVDPEQAVEDDVELARAVSELRLVKDAWEIGELRTAVEVTARGFADIVRALPAATASPRGERVIEGTFALRAREEGNGLGYDTIAAAGPHACTLHWIHNDGPVSPGDLVLVDAGVELDSLYTADVTRTLPVSGTFTPAQRTVYEAVLAAADAAFAVARPGVRFREVHQAAMRVIAERVHSWGWLPGSVEESLAPEGQFHRRWMVHGTSHHLGLDVHDCAQARSSMYLDAELRPGMVFTIEPGLYLMPDDLLVPEEMRGIGVRIEDDVLVTEDGVENLSAMLPRAPDEVEAWMARLHAPEAARPRP